MATINASFGGGMVGLVYSYVRTKGKFDILDLISSVLGSLVSVTGSIKNYTCTKTACTYVSAYYQSK